MAFTFSRLYYASNFAKNYAVLSNIITPGLNCTVGKKTIADELGIPNIPKRPVPAFFRFCLDSTNKYPDLKPKDKIQTLAKEWVVLPEKEKTSYMESHRKENELHKIRKAEYYSLLTEDQLQQIKDLKVKLAHDKKVKNTRILRQKEFEEYEKPKQTMVTGFSTFIVLEKEKIQLEFSKNKDGLAFFSVASQIWKEFPEKKKAEFQKLSKKKSEEFSKDLDRWEKKMISIGKEDLVRQRTLQVLADGEKKKVAAKKEDSKTIKK